MAVKVYVVVTLWRGLVENPPKVFATKEEVPRED